MRRQTRDANSGPSAWIPTRFGLAHALMIVAGLVTFVAVASVLADRGATVSVLIAADELVAGTELTAADLTTVELAADDPLLPFLVEAERSPIGGRLDRPVSAGEPLLASAVVEPHRLADLRQVALPVPAVVLDGLALRVGDRIDVIGPGALLDGGPGTATFVVADAEVVRLPVSATATGFGAATARDRWVTVAVQPGSALALADAASRGELQIVRSTGASPLPTPVPDPTGGRP